MPNAPQFQLQQARSLRMTPKLWQAIGLLQFNNRDLASFLKLQADTNPFLELRAAAQPGTEADPHRRAALLSGAVGAGPTGLPKEDRLAAREASLHGHVLREIDLAFRDVRQREIASHFVEALEPSGWLGRTLQEIAGAAGCSLLQAEEVLDRLHQIDPPGLFARSLAECLRLQAADRGVLCDGLDCVLSNLPMIGRGDIDGVAAACGCNRETVLRHLCTIRTFDPKPGTAFETSEPVAAPPDLIVSRAGNAWEIDLNRSTLPTVVVRGEADPKADATRSKSEQLLLDSAKWLKRAVERRHLTTIRVGAEVVRRQSEFLLHGPKRLRPMSLRDVAKAIDMHESTVSRVTSGTLVATPRATMRLRDFFSVALASEGDEGGTSATAVREQICRMIENEDPAHPISDQRLAEHFKSGGVSVARRTIAKYRDALNIPGSAARRRRSR